MGIGQQHESLHVAMRGDILLWFVTERVKYPEREEASRGAADCLINDWSLDSTGSEDQQLKEK